MQMIIWLMAKTFRNTFRKKSSWLLFFGLPLAGILVSMLIYGNASSGKLHIGIVNADGDQALTQDAIAFVKSLDHVEVKLTNEDEMKRDISAGKLDAGIRFNGGFASSLKNGSPSALDIVSIKGAQLTAYVKEMLKSYSGNVASIGLAAKGDDAKFGSMYAEYRKHDFKLTMETLKDTSNAKDMTYQSMGFLIAFMMFSAVGLSELILKEKENRTFLRLLSSPVTAKAYVAANVAVSFIVMVLQIVVTLLFMKWVFKIDSGIPFGQLMSVLVLFGLTAIGLALLIVSFAKNSAFAGALQNFIITPTCLLAGCYFPMSIMPDSVRKISTFLPQHWLLDTVNKLQQKEAFSSLYMNFLILIAFAAAFTLIAIYRFSRNNDTRTFV